MVTASALHPHMKWKECLTKNTYMRGGNAERSVFVSSLEECCRPGCSSCGSSQRMLSAAARTGVKDEAERPPMRR